MFDFNPETLYNTYEINSLYRGLFDIIMEIIYLDCAAHTQADGRVLKTFIDTEINYSGNPNSFHQAGESASNELKRITENTANILGIKPEQIIYTSGASEANNLAIKGLTSSQRHKGRHIISTPLEHPSISATLTFLQEKGYEIDMLEINRDGKINLDSLKELLRKDTVLLSISAVDSELGVIQPIKEIAEILENYPSCRYHIDATQAIGKIPFDFNIADSVSLSAHKFFGISGSGILIKKEGTILEPQIHGGNGVSIYRSGTPCLALNASINKALELAYETMPNAYKYVSSLNRKLRKAFENYPKVRINSPDDAIPHILNLSVNGIKAVDFTERLAKYGVCVSVKSACSVPNTPSRAVMAVSRDKKNALSSWRISMSRKTTESEIERFLGIFDKIYYEVLE